VSRRRKHAAVVAASLLVGAVCGLGVLALCDPYVPTRPLVRGLRIGGQRPPRTDLRAWLATREGELTARPVVLRHGEHRFVATLGELGARVDVAATVARAAAVGHAGSVWRRARDARRAHDGQVDVPLVYRLDEAVARGYVDRFASALRVEPVDAALDLSGHRKLADRPGRSLDVEASVRRIAADYRTETEIDLVTREEPATITLGDLADIDVGKLLGSFETRYQVFERGRAANVELAARKLDALVLRPGDIVSFNQRVGPRTLGAGFHTAPEIVGDELSIGVGGGTCQVASTLHGAALYGGLDVVQRRSHSRPSSYTLLGLDATVSYPSVDLKLQNPYPFTVVVHAFTATPGTLRVELLGGDEVESVRYRIGISGIELFVRRITEKSWLTPGRAFRKQKGTRGMDVHSSLTIRYRDGRVVERQYFSGYRPTPEVFWVAPGYDRAALPQLPEHAKGVEGELDGDGSDPYDLSG
jgi:vancomycin resistance protein YoaR